MKAQFKYQLEFNGLSIVAVIAAIPLCWTDRFLDASFCLAFVVLDITCSAINQYISWRKS